MKYFVIYKTYFNMFLLPLDGIIREKQLELLSFIIWQSTDL